MIWLSCKHVGAEVSTVGVQTDVSRMQVVRKTTYASVAS